MWGVILNLYIIPQNEKLIVIPFHKCWLQVELEPSVIVEFNNICISAREDYVSDVRGVRRENLSKTIRSSGTEALIEGGGMLCLTAGARKDALPLNSSMEPKLEGELFFYPGNATRSLSVHSLERRESEIGSWTWRVTGTAREVTPG